MGELDVIGVDYLTSVLEDMGKKGEIDKGYVDNFLKNLP